MSVAIISGLLALLAFLAAIGLANYHGRDK